MEDGRWKMEKNIQLSVTTESANSENKKDVKASRAILDLKGINPA